MRNAFLMLALPFCLLASQSAAVQDQAQLCDLAAHRAARMSGVPLDILLAISWVETGRDLGQGPVAWPWTINIAGDGAFFDSADLALDQAEQVLASGRENFDVGCFQINYRWHSGAFASLDEMFDPDSNALYAANFLLTLYHSSGSWAQAIGAYHSQTDDLAQIYVAKVDRLLGGGLLAASDDPVLAGYVPDDSPILRENNFPLLQAGGMARGGSLVPQTRSLGSLFAANN
jgi:hypothetical protein